MASGRLIWTAIESRASPPHELLAALQAAVDLADKNKAVMEASGYMVTRSAEMQAVYDQCAAAIQKASNKEQA